jgi:hypothetical protein
MTLQVLTNRFPRRNRILANFSRHAHSTHANAVPPHSCKTSLVWPHLTIQVKHLRIRLPAGILPHCPYSTPQIDSMHHDRIADLTFRHTSAALAAIPAQRPSALPLHLYDPSRRQVIFCLQTSSICRVLGCISDAAFGKCSVSTGEACILLM